MTPPAGSGRAGAAATGRLFAPGPVEVPPAALAALAQPVPHHRSPAFRELLLRARERLAAVFRAPGDDVIVLTGSGTAAFEAGYLACVPRGAKVVAVNGGKFGERWAQLARRYGHEVAELTVPWGGSAAPEALADLLSRHRDAAAVTVVHSETSTGALNDVRALAEAARAVAPDALFLVDAVTSLAAAPLEPREWGLDLVVSGSQKGVMSPPGLAFAWLSERAWARTEGLHPSFYLDLRRERAKQAQGETAFTPAVSLVAALDVALGLLLEEGLEAVWARRERQNRALLAAGQALGCRAYAERPSPAVAALEVPAGVAAPEVVRGLARRGIRIAGGQDQARPVLIRPSLLGHNDTRDALLLAGALEEGLRELGVNAAEGAAVAAARNVLEG